MLVILESPPNLFRWNQGLKSLTIRKGRKNPHRIYFGGIKACNPKQSVAVIEKNNGSIILITTEVNSVGMILLVLLFLNSSSLLTTEINSVGMIQISACRSEGGKHHKICL